MSTLTRPRAAASLKIAGHGRATRTFDTFNTLNVFVLSGDGAARHRAHLRLAGGARLRRAGRRLRLVAESRAPSRPTATPTASGCGPQARFHDGSPLTGDGRRVLDQMLKEKGHPDFAQALSSRGRRRSRSSGRTKWCGASPAGSRAGRPG